MRSCSKYVVAGLAFLAFAANASVHTNTYVGGDVSLPGSYSDNYVPGEGDLVKIGANTTLAVTNGTTEWTWFSKLGRIVPMSRDNCIVELTVPNEDNVVELKVPVSAYYFVYDGVYDGITVKTWQCGTLVKKGKGRLMLTTQNVVNNGKGADYDYYTCFHVEEGTLAMTTNTPTANYQIGSVTIDEGAKFVLPRGNNMASGAFCHGGLFGYGTITNELSYLSALQASHSSLGSFHGILGGKIRITAANGVTQKFYGRNILGSTADDVLINVSGRIGVEFFHSNDGLGSSIGNPTYLHFGSSEGGFEYLGNGSSTNTTPFILEAFNGLYGGPYGGVWHKSSLGLVNPPNTNVNYVVSLLGTNGIPCVIAGSTPKNRIGTNSFVHTVSFIKAGSGVWRFAPHHERLHGGPLNVKGGVAQFDTIDEAGRCSSLGYATVLVEPKYGGKTTEVPVDYAIRLGAEEGEKEATLEFTGDFSQACTTRKIAIDGTGGLRNNNSTTTLRWSGIYPLSEGSTLVLDGASTKSNEVAEVVDGTNGESLGIVKRGTGTWVLGGSNTFSGPVSVEAGKLIVRTVLPGDYTWFKWVWERKPKNNSGQVEEMALYDSDGYRQNKNLQLATGYSDLEPGYCAWGTAYSWIYANFTNGNADNGKRLNHLFNGGHNSYFYACPVRASTTTSHFSINGSVDTFMPVVMRLAKGKKAIDSWDFMNVWTSGNDASICTSSLHGSVDGLHWEEVDRHDKEDMYAAPGSWYWAFDSTAPRYVSDAAHTGGRKLKQSASTVTYNPLAGNPQISVATNAVLEAEGGAPVISSLSVAYSGTGTIKGFTFAETGSIDFVGDFPQGAVSVPVALEGCSGVENLGAWRVTFNGERLSSRAAVWAGNSFKIYPPGTLIVIK